ncbi:Glutathione S-transferase [Rhodospirillales bacterium URHD0017]|nr:Glutathione S-transferase [Rhodospirillales bacterium URHD0017]
MTKLKLVYFDIDGARGEAARLAMVIGKAPFEDDRVKFADWGNRKSGTPFGALPVLERDGQTVAQSNGINRYVGKLAELYPADAWQAALCDEAMDAVEEIATRVWSTMRLPEAEKKAQRESLAAGPLSHSLDHLQRRLVAHGGQYFADGRLTIADLKVFVWIRHLRSGDLDHVPVDLADRVAPRLVEHYERVKSHPAIKAYYAERKVAL